MFKKVFIRPFILNSNVRLGLFFLLGGYCVIIVGGLYADAVIGLFNDIRLSRCGTIQALYQFYFSPATFFSVVIAAILVWIVTINQALFSCHELPQKR